MSKNSSLPWILLGVGAVAYIVYNQGSVTDEVEQAESDVTATLYGWKAAGSGPVWVPYLNQVEQQFGFPADILAATAYQESSFKEGVIRGTTPSSDGLSLGIMQLQTKYYPSVQVATPFTDADVEQQIQDAATTFQTNYAALGSWPETIAAYNQGLSGVQNNGITSTQYVANILANAPAANA
jgi:membrane-bound lytic murein transglycosylase MltF